jgi:hypothetical protein
MPSSNLLFAVVDGATLGGVQANTVAIVGMDGYAKAKARFQPRGPLGVPDAAVPQQSVAQVVGQYVYYIDGAGTVRLLRVGAQPQAVATFSLQPSQEEVWFATSPSYSTIVAGVLTFPALGPPASNAPWPTLVGPWKFDLESALAGGQTTVLKHLESNTQPDLPGSAWQPIFPVGWGPAGAVAMVPITIGTQSAWSGGPLYTLDQSGKQSSQLGGSDCDADSITDGYLVACTTGKGVLTVRDFSGRILWTSQLEGFNIAGVHLSPDGQGISNDFNVEVHNQGLIAMPPGFNVEGWLDNGTLMGRTVDNAGNQGDLSWVSLSDPGTLHDLGFKGDFVATLAGRYRFDLGTVGPARAHVPYRPRFRCND